MSLFDKFKSHEEKFSEEALYAAVLKEMESGIRKDGLWAKALAKSEFNHDKAKALYIELRVQSVKDENDFLQKEVRRLDKAKVSDSQLAKIKEAQEEREFNEKIEKSNPPIYKVFKYSAIFWLIITYLISRGSFFWETYFFMYWFAGSLIALVLFVGLG